MNSGMKHNLVTVPFEDIELMRELYHEHGMRPKEIAEKFEVNIHSLKQWLYYRYRVNA